MTAWPYHRCCTRPARRSTAPCGRPTARTAPATTPSPSPGQPVRSVTERRQPASTVRTAPRQQVRERSERHRQQVAASVVCRSTDSVAPKGDSMQPNSVPLLINGADDDSGTFTGLASVVDNLDHDGDIVRHAFSKSPGSGTRRYRWSGCIRLMTHAAMSVMSSSPPRPTTVGRSRAGLISTPSSASRPTETPRAAECQVCASATRSATPPRPAAGTELTDLELIEVLIVARGANDRGSGRT